MAGLGLGVIVAMAEGLTEVTLLELAVGIIGSILVPLWLQGRDNRRRTDDAKERAIAAAVQAAEGRGRSDAQTDESRKMVVGLHRRLDRVEGALTEMREYMLANKSIPPASSPSRPPVGE